MYSTEDAFHVSIYCGMYVAIATASKQINLADTIMIIHNSMLSSDPYIHSSLLKNYKSKTVVTQ